MSPSLELPQQAAHSLHAVVDRLDHVGHELGPMLMLLRILDEQRLPQSKFLRSCITNADSLLRAASNCRVSASCSIARSCARNAAT
jgi:hypothetical protein